MLHICCRTRASRSAPQPFPPIPPRALSCSWTGAGARQQEGAEVVIHVSTSRTVPKVVGSSQDSALKALSDNGFENVDVQLERSDEPEGTVLSVSPEEGEKAKASTSITLKVAQAYTVPDVSGMSYNQAVQAIKDAGLSSTAVYVYSETTSEGAIMGVEPAAGSKVPPTRSSSSRLRSPAPAS